jgi:outer membrane protein TolC
MQMFPWFGTLKAARDEMSLMAQAKYEAFLDAKSQVYYDVQRTWYDLYRINNEIKISERNLQILKAIERIALVKYGSSGAGGSETSSGTALTDLYRIRIETGELENNIALFNDRKKTLTAVFNSYLDRNPATAVEITDTLLTDTLDISLLAVPDSILANNPMLSMLRYEEQSYNSREKMVSRMGLPMLGLGIDYSLIRPGEMSESPMNGKDMIMPMVSLTLPVYRKKYRSFKNETELLKESVAQNYSAMENSLQTEYFQALQMHEDARRRLKLYSDEYMLAKKSLDIILKSFSASGSSLTDVLRLQQQVLDYELKQSGAVADCNTSVAWLRRLTAVIKI